VNKGGKKLVRSQLFCLKTGKPGGIFTPADEKAGQRSAKKAETL